MTYTGKEFSSGEDVLLHQESVAGGVTIKTIEKCYRCGSLGNKGEPCDHCNRMPEAQVNFHMKCVAGRVLTLVDGMVAEGRQNQALKTLIKKEFREEFNRVFQYIHNGARGYGTEGADDESVFEKESR